MSLSHVHFLSHIQADRNPQLTQAVYADWLEEQGNVRAVLLRLGAEIWSLNQHQWYTGAEGRLLQRYRLLETILHNRQLWLMGWLRLGRLPYVGHVVSQSKVVWWWIERQTPQAIRVESTGSFVDSHKGRA